MQNYEINDFVNACNMLIPDTANRRVVVPAIIGTAVASFIPVQLGQDVNPMTVYASGPMGAVSAQISKINENCLHDVEAAMEAARAFYLVRYRIANGMPGDAIGAPEMGFMCNVLGMSSVYPMEVHKAINATGLSATTLYQKALLMVDTLNKNKLVG